MKVYIDGKELDPSDWYLDVGGSIRVASHITPEYGATLSVEYEPGDPWYPLKFGDILSWVGSKKSRMMFISNADSGNVHVMALDDPTYPTGRVVLLVRETLALVEAE